MLVQLLVMSRGNGNDFYFTDPGDFATRVTEINSQSDLIWMSSFAGLSYLTIRSSNFNLSSLSEFLATFNRYNIFPAEYSDIRQPANVVSVHFIQITETHSFLLHPSIRPIPAQVISLSKGPPKLCIECRLVSL